MKRILLSLSFAVLALLAFHGQAQAISCPQSFVFTTGQVLTAAVLNANPAATANCFANIDNSNIGVNGIYASQIIPTTIAQATFGGTQTYTFPGSINVLGSYQTSGVNFFSSSPTFFTAAFGLNALENNSASYNTAVGYAAMFTNVNGSSNVGIGYQALYLNTGTSATENVAVGVNSLYHNVNERNTAVGYSAGYGITGFDDDTALGYETLYNATGVSSGGSTAVGSTALYFATGQYDTALGYATGEGITTGQDNTLLGSQPDSGSYNSITTGQQNVTVGYDVAVPFPTANGQLSINNAIYGTGNTGTQSTVSSGCIMLYVTTCPGGYVFDVNGAAEFTTIAVNGGATSATGDLGVARSSTTGLISFGTSYGSAYLDYGVNHAGAWTLTDGSQELYVSTINAASLTASATVCTDSSKNFTSTGCGTTIQSSSGSTLSTNPLIIHTVTFACTTNSSGYCTTTSVSWTPAFTSSGSYNIGGCTSNAPASVTLDTGTKGTTSAEANILTYQAAIAVTTTCDLIGY